MPTHAALHCRWLETVPIDADFLRIMALPPMERLGELVMLVPHLPEPDWLKLLGKVWSTLPIISVWKDFLFHCTPLGTVSWPVVEMMDAEELAAFIALPEEFLAYRGALAHNHAGLCWSVDEGKAGVYAYQYATRVAGGDHQGPAAYRLTARIDKAPVIAVKRINEEVSLLVSQVDYLVTDVLPRTYPASCIDIATLTY